MPIYSDKVMDHFTNPRNVGEISNPDGVGEEGNPVCGDMMTSTSRSRKIDWRTSSSRPSAAGRPSPYPAW